MLKLSQRGAIQFIILFILLGGIIAGVWLVTAGPLKLFPKASVSGPVTPETSFTLNDPQATVSKAVGSEFEIQIWIRSDIDAANLFVAKLNFPNDLLEVVRIDKQGTFVTNWVEEYFDNSSGSISLVGGVPSPGFNTTNQPNAALMAKIVFKAKTSGSANISFTDESAIYRNSDNIDILGIKRGVTVTLGRAPVSAPIPPSPVLCTACNADINKDGGVDIVDYSKLVACFGKRTPGCSVADVNKDGVVDVEDFSCLRAKFGQKCSVIVSPAPSPTPVSTVPPTVSPAATPKPGTGDGNNNGRIDLGDLSVLLSNLNKTSGINKQVDLNGDGKVNTFDFGLMRNLLIQKGIIKD